MNFFRSPEPDRSWITAAGAVLDAAAMVNSTDRRPEPADGEPVHPLGVHRAALDRALLPHARIPTTPRRTTRSASGATSGRTRAATLEAAGVPLRADRDQAWRDFAGWRVNYDIPLVMLAGMLVAPYAPWSSDRSIPFKVASSAANDRWAETAGRR